MAGKCWAEMSGTRKSPDYGLARGAGEGAIAQDEVLRIIEMPLENVISKGGGVWRITTFVGRAMDRVEDNGRRQGRRSRRQ